MSFFSRQLFVTACATLSLMFCCHLPTFAQSPAAFYTFDDGTARDVTGNGFDGTLGGSTPTFTTSGFNNGAFQFDGFSNFISIDSFSIEPSVRPQITMGAWVNSDVADAIRSIMSNDDGGFDRSLDIDTRGGSGVRYAGFAGNQGVVEGGPTVIPGQWTFIALRHDQDTGEMTLDVDDTRINYSGVVYDSNGISSTSIGASPTFSEFWSGRIDNVFFYNSFLSDSKIDSIRLGGAAAIIPEPSTLGLLAMVGIPLTVLLVRRRTP